MPPNPQRHPLRRDISWPHPSQEWALRLVGKRPVDHCRGGLRGDPASPRRWAEPVQQVQSLCTLEGDDLEAAEADHRCAAHLANAPITEAELLPVLHPTLHQGLSLVQAAEPVRRIVLHRPKVVVDLVDHQGIREHRTVQHQAVGAKGR